MVDIPRAGAWPLEKLPSLVGWLRNTAVDSGSFPSLASPDTYVVPASGAFAYQGTGFFTLSNFGLLTYSGPDAVCLIEAFVSVFGTLDVAQQSDMGFGIAKNGDLAGLTPTVDDPAINLGAGIGRYSNDLSGEYLELTSLRQVNLTSGDTIQGAIGTGPAGKFTSDITLGTMGMTLTLFV